MRVGGQGHAPAALPPGKDPVPTVHYKMLTKTNLFPWIEESLVDF